MKKLLTYFLLVAMLSCREDDDAGAALLPDSLQVEVTLTGPTTVRVRATARHANYFQVYFGERSDEMPVRTTTGEASYTYKQEGSFTIRVQAHATDNDFITESKTISIELKDELVIPSEGYSTPETYSGMQLVWQDEFNGDQLNNESWSFEIGTGEHGWGNNELQYYRSENTSVVDGHLMITAKKESYQGSEYTSSRLITQGKFDFQYGRVDIRAVLPRGQGIWPALWMLGSSFASEGWPRCGEIDIMEMIGGSGRENTVHGTVHWDSDGHVSYGKGYSLSSGTFADKFHVFSIVWDANTIRWYVDDVEYNVIDITPGGLSEFHQPFFLIFNVAVGGDWPGSPDAATVFPQRLIVDYVRVFQPEDN